MLLMAFALSGSTPLSSQDILRHEDHPLVCVVSNINMSDEAQLSKIKAVAQSLHPKDSITMVILGLTLSETPALEPVVALIDSLKELVDNVYIIPSWDMWEHLQAKGLKDYDDRIQEYFKQDIIIPDNACGELETKELTKDIVLATFDSNWYMQNWSQDQYFNRSCVIRDRTRFWLNVKDELSSLKDKNVLLFTYHPPIRYDKSNGYLSTLDYLWPVPYFSAIGRNMAAYSRGPGSATHQFYKEFSSKLTDIISLEPNVLSISADGKYQMSIDDDEGHYVNVNSGMDQMYIESDMVDWNHPKSSFLIIQKKDSTILRDWYLMDDQSHLTRQIQNIDQEISDDYFSKTSNESFEDSIRTSVLRKDEIISINGFFFGRLNSELYNDNIIAPTLDLKSVNDSLQPVKIGGGNQTISVRLQDKEGKVYVARSLRKYATKLIPPPFDIPFVDRLAKFYLTAAHPYGFLVSSKLEQELQLLRTEPKLMYLPKQAMLDPYNDEIGNNLVLFRPRADGDMSESSALDYSEDVISTSKLIDKLNDNRAKVNAKLYLKARLLDLYINDWDRHNDQWRWAEQDNEGDVDLFGPVPRDRDQALSNYDGLLLSIVRYYIPASFPPTAFHDQIKKRDIKWLHYLASQLDKRILSSLSKSDWEEVTSFFMEHVTQEVIETLKTETPLSKNKTNEIMFAKLISRLSTMEEMSAAFYQLINEHIVIIASNEDDEIIVEYTPDSCRVKVIGIDKKDENSYTTFSRTFSKKDTKEIWLYALDGDDELSVTGQTNDNILLRVIGGYGEDSYHIAESVPRSNYKIYELESTDSDRTSDRNISWTKNKNILSLSRPDFRIDHSFIIPDISFNRDDGVLLGSQFTLIDKGFKSLSTHKFSVGYATASGSSSFSYEYQRASDLSDFTYYLNASYYGPRYINNFFGIGNDSEYDTSIDNEFYFVRQKLTKLHLTIERAFPNTSNLALQIGIERNRVENNRDRFVTSQLEIEPLAQRNQFYANAAISYKLENFDKSLRPHNGVSYALKIMGQKHISSESRDRFRVSGSLKYLKSLGHKEDFIYGTKIGAQTQFGNPYFYNLNYIGGDNELRGFRRNRFAGHTSVYQSHNLHWYASKKRKTNDKLHSFGLSTYLDYGRVWSSEAESNTLHHNYGAGLFFNPLDVTTISVGYFISGEENQLRVGLGWLL